ncbi:MAG: hypothetical protein K2X66_06735 [Cyanobacteria bacterium]|nr:hypothetical protein [Cyanobacteriota bacterium]
MSVNVVKQPVFPGNKLPVFPDKIEKPIPNNPTQIAPTPQNPMLLPEPKPFNPLLGAFPAPRPVLAQAPKPIETAPMPKPVQEVQVKPKPVEKNKESRKIIEDLTKTLLDGDGFTKEDKDLIKKHISEKGIKLDTIKKIAALKPGDPKALVILNADPYFSKLGFAEKIKVISALNKITAIYNDAMKKLSAALKKDGYSDADIKKIIDTVTQRMIKFGLGTMDGLETTDDTVSTGIITSTPLYTALNDLDYLLREGESVDAIIKDLTK